MPNPSQSPRPSLTRRTLLQNLAKTTAANPLGRPKLHAQPHSGGSTTAARRNGSYRWTVPPPILGPCHLHRHLPRRPLRLRRSRRHGRPRKSHSGPAKLPLPLLPPSPSPSPPSPSSPSSRRSKFNSPPTKSSAPPTSSTSSTASPLPAMDHRHHRRPSSHPHLRRLAQRRQRPRRMYNLSWDHTKPITQTIAKVPLTNPPRHPLGLLQLRLLHPRPRHRSSHRRALRLLRRGQHSRPLRHLHHANRPQQREPGRPIRSRLLRPVRQKTPTSSTSLAWTPTADGSPPPPSSSSSSTTQPEPPASPRS